MTLRVDVASGETVLREVDLRLPGYIPLELARVYRSGYPPGGMLGHGWRFNLDIALVIDRETVTVRFGDAPNVVFKPINVGVQATHGETGMVLQHHPNEYIAFFSPLVQLVFPKRYAVRGTIPLGSIEDLGSNKIQFFYQGERLASIVDTLGREIQLLYTGSTIGGIQLRGPDRSQPPLTQRAFRYDGRGDLIEVQDAVGRRRQYQYRDHLLVASVNPLGGTEYAQYGDDKRCLHRWNTDGSLVRRFDYDDARQAVHVMDTSGRRSVYLCVLGRQVIARTVPGGQTQHFYYNEAQRPLGYSDLEGDVTTFVHVDEKRNFTRIQGNTLTFAELDERSLARTWTDARGVSHQLSYNAQGQLLTQTTADGAAWTFERDNRGRLTAIQTPEGRRIRFRSEEGAMVVEDELGLCLRERYDLMGRVVERHDDSGRQQQWQYDGEGRLLRYGIAGGYHLICTYNAAGQLASVQDAEGRKATLQYDAFGRLQSLRDEDGKSWRYGYNREGQVMQVQDQQGRMAQMTYDTEGRLVQVDGLDGQRATYERGEEGLILTVQDRGLEQQWSYGGLGTPLSQRAGDIEGPQFALDLQGSLIEAALPGTTWNWTYDAQGLLSALQRDDAQLSFAFNRDTQLASVTDAEGNGVFLHYDARGRVLEVQEQNAGESTVGHRFRYDEANRLKALTQASAAFLTFRYDLMDRLVERSLFSAERSRLDHRRGSMRELQTPWQDALGTAEGEGRIALVQNAYGMVLVLKLHGFEVPLWSQHWLLAPPPMQHAEQIEMACLRGSAALLEWGGWPALLELPQRCLDFAGTAWPSFAGDPPSATMLRHFVPALSYPLLRREDYDVHYPTHIPGIEAGEVVVQHGLADACITGSHEAGRPAVVAGKSAPSLGWLCPPLQLPQEAAQNGPGLLRLLLNLNPSVTHHAG